MDEGDDAAGLAGLHFFADGADLAPIGADAAAIAGQGHILVPDAHDAVQRVRHVIQEAGNRQAALGAAIRQDRGRRHEPQAAHVIVQTLGVADIVGIGAGDARKHVLEAFARHQIAIGQGRLAERGQQGVAGAVQHQVGRLGLGAQRIGQRRLRAGFEQVLGNGLGFNLGSRLHHLGFQRAGDDHRALDHVILRRLNDHLAVGIEIAFQDVLAKCRHHRTSFGPGSGESEDIGADQFRSLSAPWDAPPHKSKIRVQQRRSAGSSPAADGV